MKYYLKTHTGWMFQRFLSLKCQRYRRGLYINQPFLKLYFDRITIVFHVYIVCSIKIKYTTISNNSANYLQTYVLILFLYGDTTKCPSSKVSTRGCFVCESVWCSHQGLLTGLGSDPPSHALDKTQMDIDVCNLGPDIYVFRWPLNS